MSRYITIIFALGMLGPMGCQGSAEQGATDCGEGQEVEADGQTYCVFTGPIIETRFNCPSHVPVAHRQNGRVVCAKDNALPDDFLDEKWVVTDPPACDYGFEAACKNAPDMTWRPGHLIADDLARLIWNSTPDTELLDAANDGELNTREGLRTQVGRMLQSPKSADGLSNFWIEYLSLSNATTMSKDQSIFPEFTTNMGQLMLDSTLTTIHDLTIVSAQDTRNIMTTKTLYNSAALDPIVGLGTTSTQLTKQTIPANNPRLGVLTHPAFLSVTAGPQHTHITGRGIAIRKLLCEQIPPPPPEVDINPANPLPANSTRRQQLENATQDPACQGCHQLADYPAYPLEHYDAIGKWRTTENGQPINGAGELDNTQLADAQALGQTLRVHPRLSQCMTTKWLRWVVNGDIDMPVNNEQQVTTALHSKWAANNYKLPALLTDIFLTSLFVR